MFGTLDWGKIGQELELLKVSMPAIAWAM